MNYKIDVFTQINNYLKGQDSVKQYEPERICFELSLNIPYQFKTQSQKKIAEEFIGELEKRLIEQKPQFQDSSITHRVPKRNLLKAAENIQRGF